MVQGFYFLSVRGLSRLHEAVVPNNRLSRESRVQGVSGLKVRDCPNIASENQMEPNMQMRWTQGFSSGL